MINWWYIIFSIGVTVMGTRWIGLYISYAIIKHQIWVFCYFHVLASFHSEFSFSIVHEVLVEANVNCHASNYIYTNATTWWSLLILFNSSLSVTPLYDLFPQVPFPPTSLLPSSNNDQILPPLVTINPPFFRQWSMLLDINFCSFSYYDHW